LDSSRLLDGRSIVEAGSESEVKQLSPTRTDDDDEGQRSMDDDLELHLAIDRKEPLRVIRAILNSDPEAISRRDSSGRLPLHIAACSDAPLEVVRLLVDHWEGALQKPDRHGKLPLHVAVGLERGFVRLSVVRLLVEKYEPALRKEDANGRLPLDVAAYNGAPVEVVQVLVERDKDGKLPLNIAADHGGRRSDVARRVVDKWDGLPDSQAKGWVEEGRDDGIENAMFVDEAPPPLYANTGEAEPVADHSRPSFPSEFQRPQSTDVLLGRGSTFEMSTCSMRGFTSLARLRVSHPKPSFFPTTYRWAKAHIYCHGGNQDFLRLVRDNADRLRLAERSERMRIADELVQQLRLDGRRFLQFHQGDNVWRDVGDEKARQKVIQTWRDSAPSTVAQSDSGAHLPSELLKVSSQPPVNCCMHCRVRLGVICGAHSHPSFCLLSRRSSNSAEESTSKTLSRYDWSQQQLSVLVASGAHPCLLHPF
jgi:Ankyrin repeats (3 copies)